MDTTWVVLGVLQLALGTVWTGLALADRRRPPERRRYSPLLWSGPPRVAVGGQRVLLADDPLT